MFADRVRKPVNRFSVISVVFPVAMSMIMVSPTARPRPIITAEKSPLMAVGTMMRMVVCQRLAPVASEPSSPPADDPFPDQAGPNGERATTGQPLRVGQMRGERMLKAPLKQAETSKDFVPKDPFDPEIFNRRFFGK